MAKAQQPLFRRVVVKLSGEALMGPDTHGLHAPTVPSASLIRSPARAMDFTRSYGMYPAHMASVLKLSLQSST